MKKEYAIVLNCNVKKEADDVLEFWLANAHGLFIMEKPRYVPLPFLKPDRLPRQKKRIGRTFWFPKDRLWRKP